MRANLAGARHDSIGVQESVSVLRQAVFGYPCQAPSAGKLIFWDYGPSSSDVSCFSLGMHSI